MKFIIEDYLCYKVIIKNVIDFIISSVTLCLTKRLYCNYNISQSLHIYDLISHSVTISHKAILSRILQLQLLIYNCKFISHNCDFIFDYISQSNFIYHNNLQLCISQLRLYILLGDYVSLNKFIYRNCNFVSCNCFMQKIAKI